MRRKTIAAIKNLLLVPLTGIFLLPASDADAQGISLQELINSSLASQLMAGQGQEGIPVKCGFPPIVAALAARRGQIPEMQRVPPQLSNPLSYLSPGGYFLLHYTHTGEDSVSTADANSDLIPDYIEKAAAIMDSLREGYGNLGWRDPVDDGDGVYDIYFEDLENLPWGAWFGYTEPVEPTATTAPFTSASFISLENDYPSSVYGHPPLESLRVTAAHEYHHAIQLAYNLPLIESDYLHYIWFAELSATYHEDIFYDDINDYYNYLDAFLGYPQLSLTETGTNHMYGAALWAIYLDEVFESDTNRIIWTLMSDSALRPLEAHRVFLASHNTTLLESYREMTIWQLHTGSRAPAGEYFPDGANYPSVAIESLDSGTTNVSLPALASRYYADQPPPGSAGGVALRLHPSSSAEWGAGIAGEYSNGSVSGLVTSALDTSSAFRGTSVELYDWSDYGTVLQWAFTGDNVDSLTGYSETRIAQIEATASNRLTMRAFSDNPMELHQNYPNPFRPLEHDVTYFAFYLKEQASVELEIRSLNGALLWSQSLDNQPAGNRFSGDSGVGWDGRDRSGRLVPAGVYLIIARTDDVTRARKMSVIR